MTSIMNTTKEHVNVNVNVNGSEETMSKSKKKRMKRAKAKQRKDDQEENNANGLPHNSLNPLDAVRADIVKLGYELRFVDQAMDEMWTNQLDYSDKDTVLAYIEEKERNLRDAIGPNNTADADASTDTDHNTDVFSEMNSNVRKNSSADADSPTPTEASSNPSTNLSAAAVSACGLNESSAAIQGSSALENEEPSDHVHHDHGRGLEESPAGNQSPVSIPEQIQHGSSTNHNNTNNNNTDKKKPKGQGGKPLTLSAKLDIVAQSPNLTDGIIALTEWVVKAAAPTQIMELCSRNTNALRSIMKRIILSGDGKYTGQLLDLVGTILRTVGAPSKQLVSSAKALGVLLKRASDACLDDSLVTEDTKNGIADSVSNHAVKIVGSVVKSLIQDSNASVYSSKDLEADMHQLLQGSISTSSKKSTEKNVMNLMEDRDKSKSVAEKYSALVQATIQESQGDASNSQSDSSKDADTLAKPLQETVVVKDMLGEEYESVAKSKTKLATLKSREEEIATSNPERMELVNSISTYQAGKEKVVTRIEQLRAELLKLEQEEKEFDQQIQESESKLLEMDGASSEEAKLVRQEMTIVSQKVEVEACVSQVAKQLCEFDSAMKAVLNLKADERDAKVENSEDSATSPGKVLSGYLKVMSFYFSSELSVLSYVKARAEKIEADIPILEREIREFEVLGMISTVEDMKIQEKEMRSNLREDNAVIQALKKEAKESRDLLMEQLESCLASSEFENSPMEAYARDMKEIGGKLEDIGLSIDSKWKSLMTQCGFVTSNKEQKENVNKEQKENVLPTSNPPSKNSTQVSEKKMGWNPPPKVNETKSLVDIQIEEKELVEKSESRDFEHELSQPVNDP